MNEGPSIAALIAPWDAASALAHAGRAVEARGYTRRAGAMPAGYAAGVGEYLGAIALPLPAFERGRERHPNAALVTTDVARAFAFAMWVSAAFPDETFVAWRRFSGFDPCMKVLWGGKPRWKDGEDPDHEVGFAVPIGARDELRAPAEARVPLDARRVAAMLGAVVKPLKDPLAHHGVHWLHASSPLR